MRTRWIRAAAVVAMITGVACGASLTREGRWTAEEITMLRSISLGALEPLAADPSNRYAQDSAAVELGRKFFFDTRFSSNGRVSCATCHLPNRSFQDDAPLATGVDRTDRRTMPIAGTARAPFLFWDGRKDSQWSQALGPLESPVEHGGTRSQYAHVVAENYRAEYEQLFGTMPSLDGAPRAAGPVANDVAREAWEAMPQVLRDSVTLVFANIGKAIAAYERKLEPGESRFDRFVAQIRDDGTAPDTILNADEVAGLRLFIGRANCTQCHNGPMLTDDHFHNTGIPAVPALPEDVGRAKGAKAVLADEFNCRSRWSDARPEDCAELEYLVAEGHELMRAFKTPSLRNVADRAPYMHAGQVATLVDVIDHYNSAPKSPAGHTEVRRLKLSERERAQLAAYLKTLSAPVNADARLLTSPFNTGN